MNLTLATLAVVVLAVVAGLWAWTRRIRKAGEDSVRAGVAKETADTLTRMDRAGAEAPKTKDELIERLRRGGF